MPRPVPVVAHTHWDREWYVPFEAFRARLVRTLDEILDTLGRDPRWTSFLLDGQIAVLDDYLEARPAAATRVHNLVSQGRLDVGPWYVLMDEFCVSGETIIRNLHLGLAKSAALGQRRHVGYLPDMFGHTAQMPQLLALAGIGDAVVWRGVPSVISRTAFWWRSPDGSRVRAEYLPVGYANGAFLPDDPEALERRVEALDRESADLLPDPSTPLLLMNGTDHQPIQPHVPSTLEAANARQERFVFSLTSLPEYLAGAPRDGLPCWSGELRSGARAPLLAGTISNRVDVKSAAAAAENRLERLAEPLATLWLPPDLWPAEQFEAAWLQVIRNSAHDSVCACSADEVTRAVLHRYDAASTIAATIVGDALDIAGVATETEGPVVVNPSAHARCGPVELVLRSADPDRSDGSDGSGGRRSDRPADGVQLLRAHPGGTEVREGSGADLARILGELTAAGWLGDAGRANHASVSVSDDRLELDLVHDPSAKAEPTTAAVLAESWALAGALRDRRLVVRVRRPATETVVALSGEVPGFGWAAWSPQPLGVAPVEASESGLGNGLIDLRVDPLFGTFSIGDLEGLDRLVDGRDAGDTYNYDRPDDDLVVDVPDSTEIHVVEAGPVRGRLRTIRRFTWPSRLHRPSPLPVEVTTDLTLVAGERVVRVETRFDNICRDHRLRSTFDLPVRSETTTAGCAFAASTRDGAEGGPREPGLSTFPARGFVSAGGLTVFHEGVREYELIDDGRALAITLLRAIGVLSRPAPRSRPNIAGPPVRVAAAQMLGPVTARYAVAVGAVDPWMTVDNLWTPLPVVSSTGTGRMPGRGSRLLVAGAEVSALRRSAGRIEMRVFNPSDTPTRVGIAGHRGVIVGLDGEQKESWNESFELGPWQIKTALLDALSLDDPSPSGEDHHHRAVAR